MTKKIRRSMFKHMFLDYEKEEKWLNDMCKDGYALRDFENGYYIFEACKPGEYSYHISLLHQNDQNNEKVLLQAMEKKNATLITSINRWYYFRRKSKLGEFSFKNDIQAKVNYYKKISIIWYILASICFLFAIVDFIVITSMSIAEQTYLFNIFFLVIGFVFIGVAYPLMKKVRRLKAKS